MDSDFATDQTDKNLKKGDYSSEEIVNYASGRDSIVPVNISDQSFESTFTKYENEIKNILDKNNINLTQNLFLDQIIPIIDSLNEGDTFNRVLLMHVVEFGKFSKEQPIELREFLIAYFNVYDSMKSNKNHYTNELLESSKAAENLKKRVNKHKNETIYENGLTSNSCLKFQLKNITFTSNIGEREIYRILLEDLRKSQSYTVDLEPSSLNKRLKMKVTNNDFVICSITVLKHNSNSGAWDKVSEEYVTANKIYETYSVMKFNLTNFAIVEVQAIFINSKLNFYQKRLIEIETKVEEIKHNISLFDLSLNNLQKPFSKIFGGPNQNSNSDIKDHHHISEKVEKIVSSILGKKVIIWEKILFTLNKCLFVTCLIVMMMYRSDYPTLILSSIIFAFEVNVYGKLNFPLFLKFVAASILYDLVWFLYYAFLIFFVSLWRISEMQKYNEINPEKNLKKKTAKEPLIEEEVKRTKTQSKQSKNSGFYRPSIRQSKTEVQSNIILRDADQIEKI